MRFRVKIKFKQVFFFVQLLRSTWRSKRRRREREVVKNQQRVFTGIRKVVEVGVCMGMAVFWTTNMRLWTMETKK